MVSAFRQQPGSLVCIVMGDPPSKSSSGSGEHYGWSLPQTLFIIESFICEHSNQFSPTPPPPQKKKKYDPFRVNIIIRQMKTANRSLNSFNYFKFWYIIICVFKYLMVNIIFYKSCIAVTSNISLFLSSPFLTLSACLSPYLPLFISLSAYLWFSPSMIPPPPPLSLSLSVSLPLSLCLFLSLSLSLSYSLFISISIPSNPSLLSFY